MAVGLGDFCLLKHLGELVGQTFLLDKRLDFGRVFERFIVLGANLILTPHLIPRALMATTFSGVDTVLT